MGNALYVLYSFTTIPWQVPYLVHLRCASVLLTCEDTLFSWSGPPHTGDEVACDSSTCLPFLRDKIRVMIHVTRWPYPFLPCHKLLLRVSFSISRPACDPDWNRYGCLIIKQLSYSVQWLMRCAGSRTLHSPILHRDWPDQSDLFLLEVWTLFLIQRQTPCLVIPSRF